MSKINVSNIAILEQNQVNKILSLTKQLCSIENAFVYIRNTNTGFLITSEDISIFDSFTSLYNQVVSKGIEITQNNLDQRLSSFKGIPIFNAKNEVIAALCLVHNKSIKLSSFQSDNLQVYTCLLYTSPSPRD